MARSACILVTIPISHYCEKARWALDRAGIAFEERAHLQVLHLVAVRRAGGTGTVPVLVCGDVVLADSSDILAYADSHAPPGGRLYPDDTGLMGELRALERDFDERLGPHTRRWFYEQMRGQRKLVKEYAPTGVPAWQRLLLPIAYAPVTKIIDSRLGVNAENAAASIVEVRDTFDAVAQRLAGGRRYLVGDRFTAADLTFASLAAPVLSPPGYGVPLPHPDELPAAMATVVREMRDHPAGRYALRMYREERR
ncbi:MAG: glutathione S-transferase family protein [Solirubrobacteraceae bacterium]